LNWIELKSESDLEKIIKESFLTDITVAIFKHSTRCSISSVAKNRLESSWDFNESFPVYLLDLIQYRSISNLIADKFNVQHESPQILLIKDGISIFNASHMSISVSEIHSVVD
jgi:bacillithiol system protein YtxJ